MSIRFVDYSVFDQTQSQAALYTQRGSLFLVFGSLGDADDRLVRSLIAGGAVGFFRNGQERAVADLLTGYIEVRPGVFGVQIRFDVTLTLETPNALFNYALRFTQARPGLDGLGGERGDTGVSGESGYRGYRGYPGVSGYRGYPGVSGYRGYPGVSGEQGDTGYPGISGERATGDSVA